MCVNFCKKKIIWKNYVHSFPCGIVKLGIRQLVETALDIKKSSLMFPRKDEAGQEWEVGGEKEVREGGGCLGCTLQSRGTGLR